MYQVIIIGGGVAGLQAAIQLGRYGHSVLVVDAGNGRSMLCRAYHNLLGWPDGVSGEHLRDLGRKQARQLGVVFMRDTVTHICREREIFTILTGAGARLTAQTVLLATGVVEHIPAVPGIHAALGISVYVCPDCDGYEVRDRLTVVLGCGDVGAHMALTLGLWTKHLVYIHDPAAPISPPKREQLRVSGVKCIPQTVAQVVCNSDETVRSIILTDGQSVPAERAFLAFGGNRVLSQLAAAVGAICLPNQHVAVHPRTRMTSVQNLFAAGDVVAHSEQVSIAMGDGSQAAIFMHKALQGETVDPFSSLAAP